MEVRFLWRSITHGRRGWKRRRRRRRRTMRGDAVVVL